MNNSKKIYVVLAAIACFSETAYASPLVYTPVNPNFGGSPFNAAIETETANANNQYTAKQVPASGFSATDPNNIGNEISAIALSETATALVNKFEAGQTGSVTEGNEQFTFAPAGDGINEQIIIKNILTGSTTTIEVPCSGAC